MVVRMKTKNFLILILVLAFKASDSAAQASDDSVPTLSVKKNTVASQDSLSIHPSNGMDVQLVFDISGSMSWACAFTPEIYGECKVTSRIDAARSVIGDFVEHSNPSVRLGLRRYGVSGDCTSERIFAPGEARKNFREEIKQYDAEGAREAMGIAIRDAANKDFSGPRNRIRKIVIFSDGGDTCNTDPCGAAIEMKRQYPNLIIDFIGLNVDESNIRKLRCVTAATGGTYYSVKNQSDVRMAISKAMQIQKRTEAKIVSSGADSAVSLPPDRYSH